MKKPTKGSKKTAKVPRVAKLRESAEQKQARAKEIYKRLRKAYPDAHCALNYRNPYELLVATILSAQCTDVRVNMVTPALFERYPAPDDLAAAKTEELEEMIRSTGFFRNKAKSLLGMSNAVVEQHGGRIPEEMDALVDLPGVGRKTANVVLGNAFDKNIGVVVDTHVARVSGRLGLTFETDPIRIEQDLMELFPRKDWTLLSHLFIEHGRQICKAPTPKCEVCMLSDICPSSRV
ncbi:MAG TPA: endonuclease III [Longimicrobiales bacterium]